MKPGWKTSEFWLSLLTVILSAVTSSDLVSTGSAVQKILCDACIVLTSLGYTAARVHLKGKGQS